MTWRIELSDTNDDIPVVTVIKAQAIWKRLSKAAQEAVEAAYPDGWVVAHPATRNALVRHGFIMRNGPTGWGLTDAGRSVAKWCVKP